MTTFTRCRQTRHGPRGASASRRRTRCRLCQRWIPILVRRVKPVKVASSRHCGGAPLCQASAGKAICQLDQPDLGMLRRVAMDVAISAPAAVGHQVSNTALLVASKACPLQMQHHQVQAQRAPPLIRIPNRPSTSDLLIARLRDILAINNTTSPFLQSNLSIARRRRNSSLPMQRASMALLQLLILIIRTTLPFPQTVETITHRRDSCHSLQRCTTTRCSSPNSIHDSTY